MPSTSKKSTPVKRRVNTQVKPRIVASGQRGGVLGLLKGKWGALIVAGIFMLVGVGTLGWSAAATTTHSVWDASAVPRTISDSDRQSVEIGMKFQTAYTGEITGVRFYKGPHNTGKHTGNLWSADGRRLATVTFGAETTTGWQSATFAKAVPISANTTYIVSYFAPKGRYSVDENYFKRERVNGPLKALKNGEEGGNGVYVYSSKSSFPSKTYASSNYWVDVVFTKKRFNPSTKPQPPTGLKAVVSGTSVNLSWTGSVSAGVNRYEVVRDNVTLKSNLTGTSLVDAGLTAGKTYSYKVRAINDAGDASDFSNTVNATISAASPSPSPTNSPSPSPSPTPSPTPTPAPGQTSSCPLPKYPTVSCTGVPAGVSLQTVNGDLVVTTPGQVIDGKRVTGIIDVRANDVVIKNSEIYGAVINDTTSTRYRFTIQDSTVGRDGVCGTYENGAVGIANYTARRVRILNFPDAFRIAGSNITIEDSYAKLCSSNPIQHSDGIQAYDAKNSTNITIRHNAIDQRAVTNGAATAPIFIPNDGDRQGNENVVVNVIDNLVAGGGYGFRVFGYLPFSAPNVTGNKVVDRTWEYGPVDVNCTYIGNWSGNAVVTYDFATGTILSQVRALNDCN